MRFTNAFVAAMATLSTSVSAVMTAPEVIAAINVLTHASAAIEVSANQITLLSGALFLIGQGPFPAVINGVTQLITTANTDIQTMGASPTIFAVLSDEEDILETFTTFVEVHQQLLNTLIGKAGILNDLPLVGPPVAGALRTLEAVVDTLAFALIDSVPDVSTPFTAQKNALDVTIEAAIAAYASDLQ